MTTPSASGPRRERGRRGGKEEGGKTREKKRKKRKKKGIYDCVSSNCSLDGNILFLVEQLQKGGKRKKMFKKKKKRGKKETPNYFSKHPRWAQKKKGKKERWGEKGRGGVREKNPRSRVRESQTYLLVQTSGKRRGGKKKKRTKRRGKK